MKNAGPNYFAGQLQPHQAAAVERLRTLPRALLADDVGLGKTITAIGHICDLHARGELKRGGQPVWWITSSNLIEQALSELRTFAPELSLIDQTHRLFSPNKRQTIEQYRAAYPHGPDVVVISPEQASKNGHTLSRRFREPALVVIDEAGALRNMNAAKHGAVRDLTRPRPGSSSTRVLVMTATPYENHPFETYALLRLAHTPDLWTPPEFEREFVEMSEGYAIPGTNQWVDPQPTGWKLDRLPEFRDYFERYTIRRTAQDVSLPLPRRVGDRYKFVTLTGAQAKAYQTAAAIPGRFGHMMRTQAGRSVDDGSALVEAFIYWLMTESRGEKVIVYCESVRVVSALAERLSGLEINSVQIEGAVAMKTRNKRVAEFNDPASDVRVLIGSKVLELGLNLQSCRNLISLDASENPQREAQREGRIRRIGSPHETYRHITFLPDTPTAHNKVASLDHKSHNANLLLGAFAPAH